MATTYNIEKKLEDALVDAFNTVGTSLQTNSITAVRANDMTSSQVTPRVTVKCAGITQNQTMHDRFVADPAHMVVGIFTKFTNTTGDITGDDLKTYLGYVREVLTDATLVTQLNLQSGLHVYPEGVMIGETLESETIARHREVFIDVEIQATNIDV